MLILSNCKGTRLFILPHGSWRETWPVFLRSFYFLGKTRTCCHRSTAGICCWTRWGGRARTTPPWVTSTSTTSSWGSCRSARTPRGYSRRWGGRLCWPKPRPIFKRRHISPFHPFTSWRLYWCTDVWPLLEKVNSDFFLWSTKQFKLKLTTNTIQIFHSGHFRRQRLQSLALY